jgi:hypothetical protein
MHPDGSELGFADLRVRARRDFRKLLGLSEAIALLHQHQRPLHTLDLGERSVEAVQVEPSDIALARRLLEPLLPGPHEVPPHTRRVLALLDRWVDAQARRLRVHRDHVRFSQRELREQLTLGRTQLAMHLRRLVEVELVQPHRSAHGTAVYSLCFHEDPGLHTPDASGGHPGGVRGVSGLGGAASSEAISATSRAHPASTAAEQAEVGSRSGHVHVPQAATPEGSAR